LCSTGGCQYPKLSHFSIIFSLDNILYHWYITIMMSKELKEWRYNHGYSQSRLAKALNVAVMTVSRWETGLRAIPSFLRLALRCLELEGYEPDKKERKMRKERRLKK